MSNSNYSVVCCYHASCMDGLLAAAMVYRAFQGQVECIAVRYNEPPPLDRMVGKHVYLVDFSYPPETLKAHIPTFMSMTILDHHRDAMLPWLALMHDREQDPDLAGLAVFFDNAKSGAMLAWSYFFATDTHSLKRLEPPVLIQYAQEYDLWTKGLPKTDEVQSALRYHYPPHVADLKAVGDFVFVATLDDVERLKTTGAIIQDQERIMTESMIKRSLRHITFLGHADVPVVQMPVELANQAGEILYTRYPDAPFVVMFEDNYRTQSRKYSLRSRRDGGLNVSEIAARLGGKGHYNSSGATVSLELPFHVNPLF